MAKLSLWLPPFAGDYSGASSVLFGMDCMTVLLDAGCCTRNYVEYDEPRWTNGRRAVFSAQIRTLDTALGDERSIVGKVAGEARKLKPSCVAIVGTPVPAIVGMDLDGIAADVQAECGIPSFGVATNGFDTYERGSSRAYCALMERFAIDSAPVSRRHTGAAPLVNVFGLTPHDFPSEEAARTCLRNLENAGMRTAFCGVGEFDLESVRSAACADASIAVSWSGIAAARSLEQRCGIPYSIGIPFDQDDAKRLIDAACSEGRHAVLPRDSKQTAAVEEAHPAYGQPYDPKVLLVGEQVAMAWVRERILREGVGTILPDEIAVASFFAMDRRMMAPGDFSLNEDGDLARFMQRHPFATVVGDPLLLRIPSVTDDRFVALRHPAVSSMLYQGGFESLKGAVNEIQLRRGA